MNIKNSSEIKSKILGLLDERRPMETICPSEVARSLYPNDWRDHMEAIREVAVKMAEDKFIDLTQSGERVSPPFKGPIRLRLITNYREHPELYRVLKGEQGVLTFEPYKSELLPLWKFKTPADAKNSSERLVEKFYEYLKQMDFAGMDLTRKFIQMGYTRARRYANHRSGRKYDKVTGKPLPLEQDSEKAKSAEIFKKAWDKIERNKTYQDLKKDWKIWYG